MKHFNLKKKSTTDCPKPRENLLQMVSDLLIWLAITTIY